MRRVAAIAAIAVAAAACDLAGTVAQVPPAEVASPAPVPTDEPGSTLRWALARDPGSLDPRDARTVEERVVVGALFDALTTLDSEGEAVGALATSWEADDTATRWEFSLDPRARWHDGTEVVAADVERAWRRLLAPADDLRPAAAVLDVLAGAGEARAGGPLRGVTTPDDHTVVLDLNRPEPDLPRLLAHPGLAPVPPVAEEDPAGFAEHPVGNGPWSLAEAWAHNQFLRLVAVPGHPRPGDVREVVFRVYAGDEQGALRYEDLGAGTIQVAVVPAGLRTQAREEHGVAVRGGAGVHDRLLARSSLLLLDPGAPPLDDARFRRAVALLVDREALAASSGDERVAADGLVPPTVPGALPGACAWCRLDEQEAATLVAAVRADLPEGERIPPLTLLTSPDPLHRALATDLAARLGGLGVEVVVEQPPASTYLARAADLDGAVVRLGFVAETTSLGEWVRGLLAVDSTPGGLLRGDDPDLARRLALPGSPLPAVDALRHRAVLRQAQDAATLVPVLHYRDDLLVGADVRGLHRQPTGDVELTSVFLLDTG